MISENAKKIIGTKFIENVVGEKQIADNISFVCVDKGELVTPRFNFGVVKNGKYRQCGIQNEINITLVDGVTKENLEDALEKGDAIKFTSNDLVAIAKEIGYLIPVSKENIRPIVEKFCYGNDGDLYRKIKTILNDDEKASFEDWEKMVGYEMVDSLIFGNMKFKKYNCENSEVESALHVVMSSQRLLNCAIYLKESFLMEHDWSTVWNYLLCYEHLDSFVEVMHFSDWNNNNPDTLHEKYNIPDNIVEREDRSFIRRNDASVYVGEDYKMAIQIRASFDDWDGIAVVVPKDCKLSPMEIVSAGESVNYLEDNFFVKNQLVRRI